MSVTPASLTLSVGGSTGKVYLTNVNGSASATVSNSSTVVKVTLTKTTTTSYTATVTAVAAGTATISFKDLNGTASQKVSVSVSPPSAEWLTGRLLASNCFQCHGTNGSGGFDKLAASSYSEIYNDLVKFATGKEDPSGIMAAHASGYTDAQMRSIATYFSTLP